MELKDEMTWSHEENQGRELTHFECKIAKKQEKEIVAASRRNLEYKYTQEEYEDKHSNEVLT